MTLQQSFNGVNTDAIYVGCGSVRGCIMHTWRCVEQLSDLSAGCGTGLVFLNNIAQLVRALGGSGSPAVYVSVFSVSSCAGRLLLG